MKTTCLSTRNNIVLLLTTLLVVGCAFSNFAQGQRDGRPNLWQRLKNADADNDGRVSAQEFRGPDRMFSRLDKDNDGFITKDEANNSPGFGPGGERRGPPDRGPNPMPFLRQVDTNEDRQISKEEWNRFFEKADKNNDGLLDRDELNGIRPGRPQRDNAPRRGAQAPQIKLKRLSDGQEMDLTQMQRPTVLVFGSYT